MLIALGVLLATGSGWKRRILGGIACASVFSIIANVSYRAPSAPADWHAVSFQLGKSPQLWSDEMALRRKFLVDTAMRELTCGAKVVIFPESISGSNRRLQATEWLRVATAAAKRETTVLVGEETWNENRSGYKTHRALLAGRADLLVSAANQWPSSGTSAEIAQDTHRVLLARMAGVAILIAKNR